MRTPTIVRSKRVLKRRLDAFEAVLPELTLIELQHLLGVLLRQTSPATRRRIDLVRKEMDGRRFVYLRPSVVMP